MVYTSKKVENHPKQKYFFADTRSKRTSEGADKMKINQINPISRIAQQAYQKNTEQQHKKTDGEKKAQMDQIELSSEAQIQLQTEKDKKIAQLKEQIASGNYQVNSEKIAEKLLAYAKSGAKIDE
jgi:negative regulator of flagellin synthesis FlgM